ncbi:hypothetical protein [Chryseobacterium sp.]|uniref:hypothetical protein n=1 Tax=Chryseobacterium sp. TaxID=1871047 RepID=UPI0025BFF276|nr:hypothetical protein [Chryseobacterium sp.]
MKHTDIFYKAAQRWIRLDKLAVEFIVHRMAVRYFKRENYEKTVIEKNNSVRRLILSEIYLNLDDVNNLG